MINPIVPIVPIVPIGTIGTIGTIGFIILQRYEFIPNHGQKSFQQTGKRKNWRKPHFSDSAIISLWGGALVFDFPEYVQRRFAVGSP